MPMESRRVSLRVEDLDLPAGIDRPAGRRPARPDASRSAATSSPAARESRRSATSDAYQRAVKMMRSSAAKAFDLDEEPAGSATRTAGTRSARGACSPGGWSSAGCRSSRSPSSSVDGRWRLGWDTHQQNFDAVEKLSGVLDAGWSTLMSDLARAACSTRR